MCSPRPRPTRRGGKRKESIEHGTISSTFPKKPKPPSLTPRIILDHSICDMTKAEGNLLGDRSRRKVVSKKKRSMIAARDTADLRDDGGRETLRCDSSMFFRMHRRVQFGALRGTGPATFYKIGTGFGGSVGFWRFAIGQTLEFRLPSFNSTVRPQFFRRYDGGRRPVSGSQWIWRTFQAANQPMATMCPRPVSTRDHVSAPLGQQNSCLRPLLH